MRVLVFPLRKEAQERYPSFFTVVDVLLPWPLSLQTSLHAFRPVGLVGLFCIPASSPGWLLSRESSVPPYARLALRAHEKQHVVSPLGRWRKAKANRSSWSQEGGQSLVSSFGIARFPEAVEWSLEVRLMGKDVELELEGAIVLDVTLVSRDVS